MFLLKASHPFIIFFYMPNSEGNHICSPSSFHNSIFVRYHPSHKASSSISNLQSHLSKRTLLKTFKSLTPSPHHCLGDVTVSRPTRWNFFVPSAASQMFLCYLSSFSITPHQVRWAGTCDILPSCTTLEHFCIFLPILPIQTSLCIYNIEFVWPPTSEVTLTLPHLW